MLPVVARTAEILHPGTDLTEQTDALLVCFEIGLPKELAPLGLAVGRTLNRGEYLQLLTAGLGTPKPSTARTTKSWSRCSAPRHVSSSSGATLART